MWVDVVSRWVHVGAAVVLVGGSIFIRFVLMPAAQQLSEAEHDTLRGHVMNRWKRVVMIGIGLLLATGFYNYLHSLPHPKIYNMLMGIKMLLAFAVFFLGSALTGRAAAFEGIRRNSKLWLSLLIVLAAGVIGIAGYLRVAGAASG